MEEEDDATLSNLFKSLHASSSKLRRSKKKHAAEAMQKSPLQISAKGHIVWAKISPSNWFPGQIKGFVGSRISISFFGCNKTSLFNSSEILDFEEAFPRMVKMVGEKLSFEIGLALDELTRSIAVGLKCCCRVFAEDGDRSLDVKRGFNPLEIFRFVREKAVSAEVVEGEIATLVRVSAALNAFQYGLVVCNTSEVDEEFCAEGFLDCVLDMAVNRCCDDEAVGQVYAFRRFAAVKPAWFYRLDWEFDDDSLDCRKIEADLELPDCTTEDELYHEKTSDSEVDVSINPQKECEFLDMNHNLNGRNICVINMADFSILDDDSLIYDQHLVDSDDAHSAECASPMSEVNADETAADVICASLNNTPVISSPQNDPIHILKVTEEVNIDSSLVPNLEKAMRGENASMPFQSDKCNSAEVLSSADNLSIRTVPLYRGQLHYLPVNKCSIISPIKVLNRSTKPQSSSEVCSNAINASQCIDLIPEMAPFSETALQLSANKRKLHEPSTFEHHASMPFQSDKCNSAEVLSSADNFSIRTVPLYRGQLHYLPVNKCSIFSPIKVLNRSTKPQSSSEVCSNAINASQCIDLIPEMAPFAETALQLSANKRKLHEASTFEHHKSPQNSRLCSVNNPIDEHLLDANGNNDSIKLHFRNQNHFLNHPRHISKPRSRKRPQNHHLGSNCKSFYISQLARDALSSSNNTSKSSDCNNRRNSNLPASVLLNMKFPKDYVLPSKEQLAKKFSVFGPLDHTRTKIFFYTGVGQVVFLHQSDALAAYNYVTRKRMFGQANVRFWFYKYEECRNGSSSNITGAAHSSLNLKPCLRNSFSPELMDYRKNNRVRFRV